MKRITLGLICRTELYKIFKRKDSWLLFTMLLVPVLYAVGLATKSQIVTYSGKSSITAVEFMSVMFQMSQSMFIFNVILAAVVGRSLGTEIEDRSLMMYLNRVGSRKLVYSGKAAALMIYSIIVDILLAACSIALYYMVLCGGRADIANGVFTDGNNSLRICQVFTVCGFWLVSIFFVLFLSTKFKAVMCVGVYMLAYIALNLLSYVKGIGYVSPLFYVIKITEADRIHMGEVIISIVYLFVCLSATVLLGRRSLQKKDL